MEKIQRRISSENRTKVERINYVHVYITKHCNLSCRHCYTDSSPHQNFCLPPEFWLPVFKQFSDHRVKTVHIEGGEPLLYPNLEEIIAFIAGSRIKELLLVSNGILATRERLASLQRAGLRKIAISLDSLDEGIHKELRGPSFSRALAAISDAVSLGLYTRVSTVITKKNILQIGAFIDYLTRLEVNAINLDWFNQAGRGKTIFKEYQVTERDTDLLDRFERDIDLFLKRRRDSRTSISIDLPHWYERRNSFLTNDAVRTHHLDCDGLVKQLSVDERGNVYPCFIYSGGPESLGNFAQTNLDTILAGRDTHLPVSCPIGVSKHIFFQIGNGHSI